MDRYASSDKTINEAIKGGGLLVVAQWEAKEGQADKVADMWIDWWRNDGYLSGRSGPGGGERALEQENRMLRERLERLEARLGETNGVPDARGKGGPWKNRRKT